jgi:tagatose 1,6-diphosphate aldolase GatY/KbaY
MAVVSGTELIKHAEQRQIAVPSIDVAGGNHDVLHAICEKLIEYDVCAFLASTPASIESYLGFQYFVRSIENITSEYQVVVASHLDHATEPKFVDTAIETGFSSIMFDGSRLSIENNIQETQKIVKKARQFGISVEAELGIIAGKEDEIVADTCVYPDVKQSLMFIEETGIDLYAPAIGTIHGHYRKAPDIQWTLIEELYDQVEIPLVLHGGTGLSPDVTKKIIRNGFKKINYATGVRCAFTDGIRQSINSTSEPIKPQVYFAEGRKQVGLYLDNIFRNVLL